MNATRALASMQDDEIPFPAVWRKAGPGHHYQYTLAEIRRDRARSAAILNAVHRSISPLILSAITRGWSAEQLAIKLKELRLAECRAARQRRVMETDRAMRRRMNRSFDIAPERNARFKSEGDETYLAIKVDVPGA